MKFIMMIKHGEHLRVLPKELAEAINKLSAETSNSVVVASGALAPSSAGSRIRISSGQLTVTDGPFAETREIVGGFAILEYTSREEALKSARAYLDLYRKHWPGWEGEMEVRQILEPADYALESQLSQKP